MLGASGAALWIAGFVFLAMSRRRRHVLLSRLGATLAIASTCEKNEMIGAGGQLGAAVFEQSRQAPKDAPEKRRKVTLSSGAFTRLVVARDLI